MGFVRIPRCSCKYRACPLAYVTRHRPNTERAVSNPTPGIHEKTRLFHGCLPPPPPGEEYFQHYQNPHAAKNPLPHRRHDLPGLRQPHRKSPQQKTLHRRRQRQFRQRRSTNHLRRQPDRPHRARRPHQQNRLQRHPAARHPARRRARTARLAPVAAACHQPAVPRRHGGDDVGAPQLDAAAVGAASACQRRPALARRAVLQKRLGEYQRRPCQHGRAGHPRHRRDLPLLALHDERAAQPRPRLF